jgi:osmotically inducible protein OsmC
MPIRSAEAEWRGNLREGNGTMRLQSGAYTGPYSFGSRFEEATGSNPEELIAAAHAGCFSMQFSANLERAGFTPTRVHTTASVHLERGESGFGISRIELNTEAEVPGIDEATFQAQAEAAKQNCPVSRALAAVSDIKVNAKLL